MYHRFCRISFFISLFVIASLCAGAAYAGESRFAAPYKNGVNALQRNRYDSAFQYFSLAFSKGMPKDSLLYYWAEIYRKKFVLDTALALNFSITGAEERLKQKVYKQRYLIYAALGWENRMKSMLDSLKALPQYRRSQIVPDIYIGAAAGYVSRTETVAGVFPWNMYVLIDTADVEHGVFGGVNTKFDWRLRRRRAVQWRFSIGANVAKPFYVQDGILDSFKLDVNAFCSARMEHIAGRFALELRPSIQRDYDGRLSSIDNLELSYAYMKDKWFRYASIVYSIEIARNMNIDMQSASLIAHLNYSMNKKTSFGLTLFTGGFFAEELVYPLPEAANVFYVDDVTADFVTHYLDSTYTDILDTAYKTVREYASDAQGYYKLVDLSALYNQPIECIIPQSYITVKPSAGCVLAPVNKLAVSLGAGWRLQYYTRPHRWMTISREEFERYADKTARLAYNRADGNFYMLREQIMPDNILNFNSTDMVHVREAYEDTAAVFSRPQTFEQRRIDNAAVVNFSVAFGPWRVGQFRLGGECAKTWSTLGEDCPIEVPEFTWSVQLGWNIQIKPVQKL
jgi:hypothetical protein